MLYDYFYFFLYIDDLFKIIILNKILLNSIKIPSNFNLSYFFNRGSFLGKILFIQILTGLILTFLFTPSIYNFFLLISLENINFFFFSLRFFHINGASLFFILTIFHIFRGLFYFSFKKNKLFLRGVIIYFLLIIISFFGYVLPWGQMSFWGSRVITNFLRVVKTELVFFLWGDFVPGNQLMFFFFSLHFILPFILIINSLIHILLLHEIGSNSKIFKTSFKKINLSFFLFKDLINIFIILLFYFFIFFFFSKLGDPENFIHRNKIVTPTHIKPEWYFLWAYSILRAIPSKLGGVLILLIRVLIITKFIFSKKIFIFKKKTIFFFMILILLTFLGGNPVENPYLILRQIITFIYFLFIIL